MGGVRSAPCLASPKHGVGDRCDLFTRISLEWGRYCQNVSCSVRPPFPWFLDKSSRLFIELSLSVSLGSSGFEACAENLVLDIWKE